MMKWVKWWSLFIYKLMRWWWMTGLSILSYLFDTNSTWNSYINLMNSWNLMNMSTKLKYRSHNTNSN